MIYEEDVKRFLSKVKDENVKKEVLRLYNYLNREFANDLAFAQRDYELGLIDDYSKKRALEKSYAYEQKLREYLGLEPLADIDESII